MKKSKVLNVFNSKNLLDNQKLEEEFSILRSYLPDIFSIETNSSQESNDNSLQKAKNAYTYDTFYYLKHNKDLMPLHTRDTIWLSKYISNLIKQQNKNDKQIQNEIKRIDKQINQTYPFLINEKESNDDLVVLCNQDKHCKIKLNTIKKFIETDKEFDNVRNQYEIGLVGIQINDLINYKNCDYNLDIDNSTIFHPLYSHHKLNPDKVIYNTIVNNMKKLGVSQHSTEAGLEIYAPLWRKELMTDAYYNEYYTKDIVKSKSVDWYQLDAAVQFQKLWLQQREYQYYQEHKAIIDELNLATPNMKINDKQANELNRKINTINKMHQAIVETAKLKNEGIIM